MKDVCLFLYPPFLSVASKVSAKAIESSENFDSSSQLNYLLVNRSDFSDKMNVNQVLESKLTKWRQQFQVSLSRLFGCKLSIESFMLCEVID